MVFSELFVLLGILIFSLLSIFTSFGIDKVQSGTEQLSAGGYSIALASLLALTCIVLLVGLLRKGFKVHESKKLSREISILLINLAAGIVLYILGITHIGFYISTFIFIAFVFLIIERWSKESRLKAVVYSLCLVLIFYFTFSWLHIYLPDAWLI